MGFFVKLNYAVLHLGTKYQQELDSLCSVGPCDRHSLSADQTVTVQCAVIDRYRTVEVSEDNTANC